MVYAFRTHHVLAIYYYCYCYFVVMIMLIQHCHANRLSGSSSLLTVMIVFAMNSPSKSPNPICFPLDEHRVHAHSVVPHGHYQSAAKQRKQRKKRKIFIVNEKQDV